MTLRKLAGILALVLAIPTFGVVAVLVANALTLRFAMPSLWSANLGLIYLVDAVLTVSLYACLWLLARPSSGSWLLLLAAVLVAVNDAVVMGLLRFVPVGATAVAVTALAWLAVASVVSLAAGLWWTRLLPLWVTGLAAACALLRVAQRLVPHVSGFGVLSLGGLLGVLGSVCFELFVIGVAVTLLADSSTDAHTSNKRIERTPRALS